MYRKRNPISNYFTQEEFNIILEYLTIDEILKLGRTEGILLYINLSNKKLLNEINQKQKENPEILIDSYPNIKIFKYTHSLEKIYELGKWNIIQKLITESFAIPFRSLIWKNKFEKQINYYKNLAFKRYKNA